MKNKEETKLILNGNTSLNFGIRYSELIGRKIYYLTKKRKRLFHTLNIEHNRLWNQFTKRAKHQKSFSILLTEFNDIGWMGGWIVDSVYNVLHELYNKYSIHIALGFVLSSTILNFIVSSNSGLFFFFIDIPTYFGWRTKAAQYKNISYMIPLKLRKLNTDWK